MFPALRARDATVEIELIEGTATEAEPGGLVNASTWERLRDEVLDQFLAVLPVDAVVLGLHGAMIADRFADCKGALIEAVRDTAGSDATLGVTFDPHSHLSARRVDRADIITVFNAFPHTDFVDTAEACVDLTLRTARGEIAPLVRVFGVRMFDVCPPAVNPCAALSITCAR